MAVFFPRDSPFGDFDRIVSAFFDPDAGTTTATRGNNQRQQRNQRSAILTRAGFHPRLDLAETDAGYVVHADLPGIPKDKVDVSISDEGVLVISGERSANKEIKDEQRHVVERSYGRFERAVRLPQDADRDNVQAKMADGVLELVVPKLAAPKEAVKKISIL
ncbi:putative heat-shock protein [Zopfochytrium polystomum]|nr:putative heat-shock protein [Zopfochytrium polystomum]